MNHDFVSFSCAPFTFVFRRRESAEREDIFKVSRSLYYIVFWAAIIDSESSGFENREAAAHGTTQTDVKQ